MNLRLTIGPFRFIIILGESLLTIKTVVIRHKKENFKKCSLTPLESRSEIQFLTAPGLNFDATGYILLTVNAPVLCSEDQGTLLLLDATWRLLPQLEACVSGTPIYRSLPKNIMTAYPRRTLDGSDPSNGLASVEALYMARLLMGDHDESLLDAYYWKNDFLAALPACYC